MPGKRVFKSMGEFKPVSAAEAEKSENLLVIPGAVEIKNGCLVMTMPLTVDASMVNIYEESMTSTKDGSVSMIPKGNLGIGFEMPDGLELSVYDKETEQMVTYRIKNGGLQKTRRLYFGFDPTKGYIHKLQTEAAQAVA